MSVLRQENWLGQQRVDIPHLRSIESAVAGDFDLLAGTILAGKAPLVASGFYVFTTAVTKAEALQVQVGDATLIHFYASESGSIFHVPADRAAETLSSTNPRVSGSFTPGQVNYVGIDLVRSADDSTVDLVQFIDTNSLLEDPKSVPLARTLDYRFVISTTDFESNPSVAPIARVTLDASSGVIAVEDARNIFWRLGTGGSTPNALYNYPWPGGRREESSGDKFLGGDKGIKSLKEWMDAAMSRIWEVGGGEHWYSPGADRNVVLARTGSPFVSSGEYFEWDGTNLHWKGLVVTFANSTGIFNETISATSDQAGLTDLADGECIYVDIDRSQNRYVTPPLGGATALQPQKAPLAQLGNPAVPGSRWVLAWRYGSNIYVRDQSYPVGSSFKLATTAAAGGVKVSASDSASVSPITVATVDSVSKAAYASGITRGSDFFGGPGDIQIGGFGSYDHRVLIKAGRPIDDVRIEGSQNFTSGFNSPCSIANTLDFVTTDLQARTLRLIGYNGSESREEDAHQFHSGGGMGWRAVIDEPATPTPTSAQPICAVEFYRQLGTTPNARYQKCIKWPDGDITVIAESNTF
jgi:hypothetical protein